MFGLFGAGEKKTPAQEGSKSEPMGASSSITQDSQDPSREVRLQRRSNRDQLFALVRSALAGVALPAKTYKFKVMALDAAGSSFIVMIDLAGPPDGAGPALKAVEDLICSTAAVGQDLQVQGVYWRFDTPAIAPSAPPAMGADAAQGAQGTMAQRMPSGSVLDQIGVDEMLAFRAAQARGREQLAKKKVSAAPSAPASEKDMGFSETRQLEDKPKNDPSPLSPTQFGDL